MRAFGESVTVNPNLPSYTQSMAPPTGKLTVVIKTWSKGQLHFACDEEQRFLRHAVSASTKHLAILKAQEAIRKALYDFAKVHEPYYAEELASQTIFWNDTSL